MAWLLCKNLGPPFPGFEFLGQLMDRHIVLYYLVLVSFRAAKNIARIYPCPCQQEFIVVGDGDGGASRDGIEPYYTSGLN